MSEKRLDWKKIWKKFDKKFAKLEKQYGQYVTWGSQKRTIRKIVEKEVRKYLYE